MFRIERPLVELIVCATIVTVSLLYLLLKTVGNGQQTVDFQFIWLAGHMWNQGKSPYSPEYAVLGDAMFTGNRPEYWFYPPNWWPIATLTGLLRYEEAQTVWRGISGGAVISGIIILGQAAHQYVTSVSLIRWAALIAFTCLSSSTASAFALGQTTPFIFFGMACFVCGYVAKSRIWTVVGLVLMMLKPQVGVVVCAFLLTSWSGIIAVTLAAAIVLLTAVPALVQAGVMPFLKYFIATLAAHGALPPNAPHSMTGVRYLVYELGGGNVDVLILTVLACFSAFVLGFVRSREKHRSAETDALDLSILLMIILFFVPLHIYDTFIVAPIIVLMTPLSTLLQWILGIGLLIIFRANNLAELTGLDDPETQYSLGVRFMTIAFTIMLGALIVQRGDVGARNTRPPR
ncbi:MAG: glycosyltransferase 87 family protein [Hyphomicrobium sp.]|uniref:glycosyltransferase 87 family protein n=1 Tax=Hyphomicrobium sp. TaxID=82 RepID=UPI0039E3DA58